MQHQTMLPLWSTNALTVQLPINASSSVTGLMGEAGDGVMDKAFRDVRCECQGAKCGLNLYLYKYTRKADAFIKAVTS